MKKAIMCLILASLTALGLLAGCSGGSEGGESTAASAEEEKQSSAEETASAAEESLITVDVCSAERPDSEEASEESADNTVYGNGDKFLPGYSKPISVPKDLQYVETDEFFNSSVFIGYSMMMHFGRYVENWRDSIDPNILGDAAFSAGVGMSFYINENGDVNDPETPLPKYNGQAYYFQDLPKAMGVNTLYIGLMPYSDMKRGSGPSDCVEVAASLAIRGIDLIKAENPDLNLVILSGTYNTGRGEEIDLSLVNNEHIRTYNNIVLEHCNEVGVDFIDVSTPMTDGKGFFVRRWSSDGSYHILQDPYKIWIAILRDYAERKQAGTWHNLLEMPPLIMK